MFNLKSMLRTPYGFYDYIWIDCTLIRETPKAILLDFDNRKIWLPKAWVIRRQNRPSSPTSVIPGLDTVILNKVKDLRADSASSCKQPISIKISQYNWAKKVQ